MQVPQRSVSHVHQDTLLKRLAPRWFLIRNAHAASVGPLLLHPRHTMSLMREPLSRSELMLARKLRPTPSQRGRKDSERARKDARRLADYDSGAIRGMTAEEALQVMTPTKR